MVWNETIAILVAALVLVGLILAVGLGLASGRVFVAGLVSDRRGGPPRANRIQALVVSLSAIAAYAGLAISQVHRDATTLPPPPQWLIYALGASHLGYLGFKGWTAAINSRVGGSDDDVR